MEKDLLRKIYLQKRKEFKPDEAELLSEQIAENFKRTNFLREIRSLHTFYPIPGKYEVNTLLLINFIRQAYPQVKLVLSKVNSETGTLSHYIWDANTRLSMNSWGITEPDEGEEVHPKDLDLILVPLLAFDKKGNRIGYGKGFYDRFLKDCRPDALKIGLSFFEPTSITIEPAEHDIALDICVTPANVFKFKVK